ncbi:hypothetical protein [Brachybacterium phenoliresistens]|uniref:Uncharacterized protein n=1 Tax=Brachybacterium phenoliresistens TaxID=396014 RepID=Z9JXA2_9MICO|nr:hypothetical protein [Brachybacterium phenoliresistens]EWS82824.1 hypothetical protein BF93_07330 [Brachybacterium phenoliresistens]
MNARLPAGALVTVCAPPGTGKSTALPHLIARAHGRAVVADIDEVLEDGSLLGVRIADAAAAPIWPAYDRLWARIAGFVTRAGVDMVLLTQVPDARPAPAAGTLLGWEVDDELRAARLRGRGATEATVLDARSDARALRALLPATSIVRTRGEQTPQECADQLWLAIEPHLGSSRH